MGETPGSVVTLLCSGMHFFNAEKRIADCVLEDTAGVAAMTSAELAHCSSTSEATVTRFCKKLGFENYRAFQLALARDVMERQPLEISNEVQLDNIPQSLQNILSNKIDEMSATINGINPENLQRVLELLQNAQLVQIAAVGNTRDAAATAGDTYTLTGRVTRSGTPVQGITLELRSTLKTTVTDADGRFTFTDVPCGKHSLTALENGNLAGYPEFILFEDANTNFSLNNGVYHVAVNKSEAGVDLALHLTDTDAMELAAVSGIPAPAANVSTSAAISN